MRQFSWRRLVPAMSLPLLLLGVPTGAAAGEAAAASEAASEERYKHGVEVSPISLLIRIYAVQATFAVTPDDELMYGFAYMNIHYDFGQTRAPSLIAGYRRYLWRNLHLEYQLWPVYDWFWESDEGKTYESFDLWNEARVGYRFDFELGGSPVYVLPQWAFGFGLYASNKPPSFQKAAREAPFFTAPLVFVGARF